jgi:hypothetical protein
LDWSFAFQVKRLRSAVDLGKEWGWGIFIEQQDGRNYLKRI